MKTIYNTFVKMESQEQCDRMKQLCLDNDLKIFSIGFEYVENQQYFRFSEIGMDFYVSEFKHRRIEVTEQEFIELLKTK